MNKARLLHTMLRVGDMPRAVDFYTRVLGMRVLRELDQPDDCYSLAFLGYDVEDRSAVLELTYNYGVSEYQRGDAYGHVAIGVENVGAACDRVRQLGGRVMREPEVLCGGGETFAFITDPDGYWIELIERPASWFR